MDSLLSKMIWCLTQWLFSVANSQKANITSVIWTIFLIKYILKHWIISQYDRHFFPGSITLSKTMFDTEWQWRLVPVIQMAAPGELPGTHSKQKRKKVLCAPHNLYGPFEWFFMADRTIAMLVPFWTFLIWDWYEYKSVVSYHIVTELLN